MKNEINMKKIFTMALMAIAAMTATAQESSSDVLVTLDFDQNPWNHTVRKYSDKDAWGGTQVAPKGGYDYYLLDGSILTDKDFSWPMPAASGSTEKIKVTLYAVDLDEYNNVSVFGNYSLNAAEAAALFVEEGYHNILFTRPGTTMRFEAPTGFSFKKIVFRCHSMPNILTGNGEYDEEYEYTYDNNNFKTTRKFWTPESPKVYNAGGGLNYPQWEGDAKDVRFIYPYFTAYFVKIDMTLTPDGASAITDVKTAGDQQGQAITLDGRRAGKLQKGIYIVDGKKHVVK